MNLQFYFEKLSSSDEFKKFRKEKPDAFLCSGFFAIDKKGEDNKQHFDYYSGKQIFSFQVENGCKAVPVEMIDKRVPEKIEDNLNFDFADIERMVERRMEKDKMKNEVQKYILSLQKFEGVNYLVGTIFISGMGMIKVRINLDKMKIEDFEKSSFMDFFRVVRK